MNLLEFAHIAGFLLCESPFLVLDLGGELLSCHLFLNTASLSFRFRNLLSSLLILWSFVAWACDREPNGYIIFLDVQIGGRDNRLLTPMFL